MSHSNKSNREASSLMRANGNVHNLTRKESRIIRDQREVS